VGTAAAAYVAFHAMVARPGGEWPLVPSDRVDGDSANATQSGL
jgi:hypothetical protein